jgi:rhodanese-related sulfurtransferase
MALEKLPSVLEPAALAEVLARHPGVRVLDVRTAGEYESQHIRGAYNVPLETLGEHGAEIRAHVDEPIALVCQSGQRARKAEAALKESGLPNLHVLDGGMNAWGAAGLPVERAAERLTLERQVRVVAGALAAVGGLLGVLVNPLFALVPAGIGGGLVFAGLTNRCGLALVLTRLPYNRPATCDVGAMVEALKTGAAPAGVGRSALRSLPAAPGCAS